MRAYVDASPTKACVDFDNGRCQVFREASAKYTNNEAEYRAVLLALHEAKLAGYILTEICSDSQLVVNQLNGTYKVNKKELAELRDAILAKTNGRVKFTWIPREDNLAGRVLG